MLSLKNNLSLLSFCLMVLGCQTGRFYKMETMNKGEIHFRTIQIASARIQQECCFLNAEAENNWRHQYVMYLLNDKNEVLEVTHPFHQDREVCSSQMQKIKKILDEEPKVRLCLRDEMKKTVVDLEHPAQVIDFGSLGKHRVSYESLTLDSICNSRKCVSNNEVWVSTCPGFVKN